MLSDGDGRATPVYPHFSSREVLIDDTSWLNANHLNVYGARRTSTWVAEQFFDDESVVRSSDAEIPCFEGGVDVSFAGGKDSTHALHAYHPCRFLIFDCLQPVL